MSSTEQDKEFVTVSQFTRLCTEVAENTRLTQQVRTDTTELVNAFAAAKGAFKVLELLGRIFKPILAISTVVGAAITGWQTFKGH